MLVVNYCDLRFTFFPCVCVKLKTAKGILTRMMIMMMRSRMAMAASTSKAIAQPGTPSPWLDDGLLVVRTGSVLLSFFLLEEELVTLV